MSWWWTPSGDPDDPGYAPADAGDPLDPDHVRALAERDPWSWKAWYRLGWCTLNRSDDEAAADAFGRAAALRPSNALVWHGHGVVLARLGRRRTAAKALERAVALRPDALGSLRLLASLYRSLEKYADSLAMLKRLMRLEPDCADHYFAAGRCFAMLGRAREAAVAYQWALRHQPAHTMARYNLGVLHALEGDVEGALMAYIGIADRDSKLAGRFWEAWEAVDGPEGLELRRSGEPLADLAAWDRRG